MRRDVHLVLSILTATSLALPAATGSAAGRARPAKKHTATTSQRATKRGVTINVWDPFPKRSRERATLQRVVHGWERTTGDRVVIGGHAADNYLEMCHAALGGGGPDLVGVQHTQLAQLIGCRAIQPIPTQTWPGREQSGYAPAALQATRIDGKLWAMPWSLTTYGIFYNKTLIPSSFFQSRSLHWTDVIRKAKALTNSRTHTYGLVWDPANFYLDYAFISGSGGYVFKLTSRGFDRSNLGIDSPGSIAGIQLIQDLTTAGKYKLVPGTMTDARAETLFYTRKAAMIIAGPWDADTFHEYKVPFGFAPLPAIGSKPAHPFAAVQVFAVNQHSRHRKEALSLLRYMTTHMQLPEFKTSGSLPVVRAYLSSSTVQRSSIAAGLARAVLLSQAVPNIPEMNQVWAPMGTVLTQVVRGKESAEDAARSAAYKIREAIQKTRAG